MPAFQRILIAADRTDQADAPLRFALGLAQQTGAEVVVFHSISSQELEDRQQLPPRSDYVDFMEEETQRDLTALVASSVGDGSLPSVRAIVRSGDPSEEIQQVAAEENCDVIVIGLRRRSRVGKFLLGSRLQDVLMATDCPVIAVPLDDEATEAEPVST